MTTVNHTKPDQQRYVRVTKILHGRYVEFEFSVDDPTINVELVMPFDYFQDFCQRNHVKHLTTDQEAAVDFDKLKWRSGVPGLEADNENNT